MSEPPDEQDRARLISDALKLAMDVSEQGASSLSVFLKAVEPEAAIAADKAATQLRQMPSKELTTRGGRLANDALTVALDVAEAAKDGFTEDPATRDRTVDMMSQLVSFFGSMFIDTANKAVGASAGQPAANRARLVTVEIPAGREDHPSVAHPSVWVVNRGSETVTGAAVSVVNTSPTLDFKCAPHQLTIRPRERVKVTLTVSERRGEIGSFTDALLVVRGVGSIVIRTIVTRPIVTVGDAQPDPPS